MQITKKTTGFAVAAAALLIAGCASDEKMDKSMSDMGQCHGVNSCKGKSACATEESACQGQNGCKGKGWISNSKADCDANNGKFMAK